MKDEERNEEQVQIFEVLVAREVLRRRAESFLETLADTEPSMTTLMSIEIEGLQRWSEVALSDDVPKAFWQEVLRGTEYWLGCIKESIEKHCLWDAVRLTRLMLKVFVSYAELLGVEIPPEEEEEVAEEVEAEVEEAVGGTSLSVLGLSVRAHSLVWRALRDERVSPSAESLVKIYADQGEKAILAIGGIGPHYCNEILTALREHNFLPAEEAEGLSEALEWLKVPS